MSIKLFMQAISRFFLGVILVGSLIFIPAGTIDFANGWLFMFVLFVPMFVAGVVMMFKSSELLKKRLNAKETNTQQKFVVITSALMFIFGFILAGLTFRFGWYTLPDSVVVVAVIIFFFAYLVYAEVIRENKYLSRIIEIQKNQKVIDSGLYGIIRHPMYFASIIMFLAMPIILGSIYSFFVFLSYPLIIAKRIKHEEEFLKTELNGYTKYMQKVKYRLIPFIW